MQVNAIHMNLFMNRRLYLFLAFLLLISFESRVSASSIVDFEPYTILKRSKLVGLYTLNGNFENQSPYFNGSTRFVIVRTCVDNTYADIVSMLLRMHTILPYHHLVLTTSVIISTANHI